MIRTIIEIILTALVIYCVFNEDKFVEFEEKIKERVKKNEKN